MRPRRPVPGRTAVCAAGGRQQGAGTVLAAGLALVLCMMLAALAGVVQAGLASARAGKAADLAALAAADAARGLVEGEPCTLAARVAGEQDAQLRGCRRSGTGGVVVDVDTAVPLPAVWGLFTAGHAEAAGRARAGPPP
ncbi:Rv3654c family TadE-like protein [Arthrobacter mobilis]|uniref:Rv3654c family TadE-like protein n=1 Tax=Arthrobacter mobilis TaxID=2724944 RepID=UPI0028A86D00|nr:Rv3654c family TadE-like protein [Arthrobacter mobilis]